MVASNFEELEVDELKHLLGLKKKTIESEEKVYQAVIGWIQHDITSRKIHVEELLGFIKFSDMSLEFLKRVAKETILQDAHATTRAILNAIVNYRAVPLDQPPIEKLVEKPIECKHQANHLPLKDFLAVDGKFVKLMSSKGTEKMFFKYDHTGGSAAVWDKKVFVISGCNTNFVENVWVHDHTLQFGSEASLYEVRYGAAAVTFNNSLYITGGLALESSAKYCQKPFYITGVTKYTWHPDENMIFNRSGHALASLAGLVYVVGGYVDGDHSMLCFNKKECEVLAPMSVPRSQLAAVVFKEEVYAIGGISNGKPSAVVEVFNPFTKEWSRVANLVAPRRRPGACVLDNQIVVVGGESSVVEIYDKEKNIWKIIGNCDVLKHVFAIFPC